MLRVKLLLALTREIYISRYQQIVENKIVLAVTWCSEVVGKKSLSQPTAHSIAL